MNGDLFIITCFFRKLRFGGYGALDLALGRFDCDCCGLAAHRHVNVPPWLSSPRGEQA